MSEYHEIRTMAELLLPFLGEHPARFVSAESISIMGFIHRTPMDTNGDDRKRKIGEKNY